MKKILYLSLIMALLTLSANSSFAQEKTGIPEIDSTLTQIDVDDFYTDLLNDLEEPASDEDLSKYDSPIPENEGVNLDVNPNENKNAQPENIENTKNKQPNEQIKANFAPKTAPAKTNWDDIIKQQKEKKEARTNMFKKAYAKRLGIKPGNKNKDKNGKDGDNVNASDENSQENQVKEDEKKEEEKPIVVSVSGIASGSPSGSISLELKDDVPELEWKKGDNKSIKLDDKIDTSEMKIRKGTGVNLSVEKKEDSIKATSLSVSSATLNRRRSRQKKNAQDLCKAGKHPMQSTYCK
jgi:hypothetical protein